MTPNMYFGREKPISTIAEPAQVVQYRAAFLKSDRVHLSWWSAGILLLAVFLFCNWGLLSGSTSPNWDAWYFYTPQFTLVADHARAGRFLLWDPWEQAGSPDHADPQVGAASPLMIGIGAITGGTECGFRIYWFVIWLMGPIGMLLLARHLNAPPWAGLIVALGYAFCGFYSGHAEHTTFIYSFSFLPLIFWRFDRALRSEQLWPAVQGGVAWGLSALGGYPSLTVMSGGFLMIWAFGRCCTQAPGEASEPQNDSFWRRALFAAKALAVVFALGIVVLAPTYTAFFTQGTGYSERAGILSRDLAVSGGQMAPGSLLNFSSPYLILLKYPGNKNKGLWPDADLSLMAVYMGALPVILSVFAVIRAPGSGWRWWLVGLIAFAFACAVGNHLPIRGWLYDYCYPTRFFRHVGAFRAYAIFGVMVLALSGGKDLDTATRRHVFSEWVKMLCSTALISTIAIFCFSYVIHHAAQLPADFERAEWHMYGVWLACVALIVVGLFSRQFRRWLPILLAALAIVDAALTRQISNAMISGQEWSRRVWVQLDAQHRPELDLTEHGLARRINPPGWIGNPGHNNNLPLKIPTFYNDPAMRNRFHLDFAHHPVLLNMAVGADRIWFSRQTATVRPSDAAYEAFVQRSEDLGTPVVVLHPRSAMPDITHSDLFIRGSSSIARNGEDVKLISQLPPATRINVALIRYTPNHLDFTVSCPEDGWLVVTDRWASGWQVKVDGRREEVYGGNFIFRAIRVHAGENKVQFYYRQTMYFILLILSWSTVGAVLVIVPIARRAWFTHGMPYSSDLCSGKCD